MNSVERLLMEALFWKMRYSQEKYGVIIHDSARLTPDLIDAEGMLNGLIEEAGLTGYFLRKEIVLREFVTKYGEPSMVWTGLGKKSLTA